MESTFKQKLQAKEKLIGTIISLPSPEIAEIYSSLGFDWLFVDLEHGAIGILDAQRILQASSIPCLVRCPVNEDIWIKKCLDIGAAGIIVPLVKNKFDVERLMESCKYPPMGSRSIGIARAHGYGFDFSNYVQHANDKISTIIQIEHIDAVKNINEIIKVEGIDCVFVGPYDLSGSMNLIGQVEHQDVVSAIDEVTQACKMANIPLGIFASSPAGVQRYVQAGYSLIAVGTETMLLGNAASAIIKSLK